jgi:hypothetical protein
MWSTDLMARKLGGDREWSVEALQDPAMPCSTDFALPLQQSISLFFGASYGGLPGSHSEALYSGSRLQQSEEPLRDEPQGSSQA